MLNKLHELKGNFWTRLEELKEDIEELGFIVEEINMEYISIWANEEVNEDSSQYVNNPEFVIRLSVAGRTIVIDRIEEI